MVFDMKLTDPLQPLPEAWVEIHERWKIRFQFFIVRATIDCEMYYFKIHHLSVSILWVGTCGKFETPFYVVITPVTSGLITWLTGFFGVSNHYTMCILYGVLVLHKLSFLMHVECESSSHWIHVQQRECKHTL